MLLNATWTLYCVCKFKISKYIHVSTQVSTPDRFRLFNYVEYFFLILQWFFVCFSSHQLLLKLVVCIYFLDDFGKKHNKTTTTKEGAPYFL